MRRAARNFAISSKKSTWASKKKDSPGAKTSTSRPRPSPSSTYPKPSASVNASSCAAVEPGLADVVAGDRERLVRRDLLRAVLHQVADQAQVRLGGEQPLLLRDVLLEDVGLQCAVELAQIGALALGRDQHHAEDGHRRPADRHRRGDVLQWDAVEEDVHVGGGVDRDPAVADLAEALGVVGVAAHQGRHVEGHAQAPSAAAEDHPVALVGLLGVAEARELPDRPRAAAVSRRVEPARERELAGPLRFGTVCGAVRRLHLHAGQGGEVRVAHARPVVAALPARTSVVSHGEIVGRPTKFP